MSKKHRRRDEKPTGPDAGTYDPGNPEAGRMPEDFPGRKGLERPAGGPIDKPLPTPGAGDRGRDIFDGERSDRESGRPVQLEGDEDDERSDRESQRPVQLEEDGQWKGRQGRSPREVEPTKR
jgi:hypothetical protein